MKAGITVGYEMLANIFNSSFWLSTQAPLQLYFLALYDIMKLHCMVNAGFPDVSDWLMDYRLLKVLRFSNNVLNICCRKAVRSLPGISLLANPRIDSAVWKQVSSLPYPVPNALWRCSLNSPFCHFAISFNWITDNLPEFFYLCIFVFSGLQLSQVIRPSKGNSERTRRKRAFIQGCVEVSGVTVEEEGAMEGCVWARGANQP